jgi:ethanolaminephosphotransferase
MNEKEKIVIDNSLIGPKFENFLEKHFLQFVPIGIPANVITLFGNFCMLVATCIAWNCYRGLTNVWFFIPILVFIYLCCDCFDGRQARRTGTASRLGEFLDHFFDILVAGQLLAMIIFAFHIEKPLDCAAAIAVAYMTMFGTYYEQYFRRVFVFDTISSYEMIGYATLLACLGFAGGGALQPLLMSAIVLNITALELFIIAAVIIALVLLARDIKRVGALNNFACLAFIPLMFVTMLLASRIFGTEHIILIVTLYGASYTHRFLLAYLQEKKAPMPDYIFPAFLALALVTQLPDNAVGTLSYAYLIIITVAHFIQGFVPLRQYWVWRNPEPAVSVGR